MVSPCFADFELLTQVKTPGRVRLSERGWVAGTPWGLSGVALSVCGIGLAIMDRITIGRFISYPPWALPLISIGFLALCFAIILSLQTRVVFLDCINNKVRVVQWSFYGCATRAVYDFDNLDVIQCHLKARGFRTAGDNNVISIILIFDDQAMIVSTKSKLEAATRTRTLFEEQTGLLVRQTEIHISAPSLWIPGLN